MRGKRNRRKVIKEWLGFLTLLSKRLFRITAPQVRNAVGSIRTGVPTISAVAKRIPPNRPI